MKVLPELYVFEKNGLKEGVSAAFGGVLENAVLIAGGCNFPDIAAANGGKKVYYDQIYLLRDPESSGAKWEKAGRLPYCVANGASVTLPQGVVCIGGCNSTGSFRQVWLLKCNNIRSSVSVDSLPALPVAMDNLGAATDGRNIYVAGGNCEGRPANRCFVLRGLEAQNWEELPFFPGPARLQPVGALCGGKFYLMGGFQPVQDNHECIVSTDGLVYSPNDNSWSEVVEICPKGGKQATALVGAAGMVLDEEKIVFLGGVDWSVFKRAVDMPILQKQAEEMGQIDELERLKKEQAMYLKRDPEWYEFNSRILFYDTQKNVWTSIGGRPELARAGAVVVYYKGKLIIVNGEIKPGIRSAGVYMIDLGY